MSEPTSAERSQAPEILARLLPHLTSVQNIWITTAALREALAAAHAIGFAEAGAEFRAHAEKIRNATEDVSDERLIAAARAEERGEFARLAQSEEMVEKIQRRLEAEFAVIYSEEIKSVLAAFFRETGVTT